MSVSSMGHDRERPILFSSPMVRAILAGQKTQTRRLVTVTGGMFSSPMVRAIMAGTKTVTGGKVRLCNGDGRGAFLYLDFDGVPGLSWRPYGGAPTQPYPNPQDACPYGVPGDRLWVRETWRSWEERCDDGSGSPHDYDTQCGPHCSQTYVAYAASPRTGYRPKPDGATITYLDDSTPLESYHESLTGPWRPSIFMPRWASRITLELTDVRVQRLQDISEEDAKAEGITEPMPIMGTRGYVAAFSYLWDSINGKRYPWTDSNPWVWALTFRRLS